MIIARRRADLRIDRWRLILFILLLIAALGAFALSVWIAFHGRIDYTIAGKGHALRRVSPVALALWLLIVGAVSVLGRARRDSLVSGAAAWTASHAPSLAAALAIAVAFAGFRLGGFTAAGSDPYGYASQALLWAEGNPVQALPLLALDAPVDVHAFCPLGYRPGPNRTTMVPSYAPGLPLQMAMAIKAAGRTTGYWVLPLLAGFAIWWTFIIARRVLPPAAALLPALCTAASPVFLFEMMQPMSDVPVTAWWLAAIAFALADTYASACAAGLAASVAIATRPNIVPLVVPLMLFLGAGRTWTDRFTWIRRGLFLLACLPGVALVAAVNHVFFGSALVSGYGSLATIYSLHGALGTVWLYLVWLWDTHSVLIFAGFAFPLIAASRSGIAPVAARVCWACLAMFAVLLACYAPYLRFDHWSYLRFLLPAIPLLFILAVAVMDFALRRSTRTTRAAVFLFVGLMFPFAYVHTAAKGEAFVMRPGFKHAFEEPAEFAVRELPSNAIFIALIQTGSLRHYAGRLTVRFELIPPDRLDPLVEYLQSRGFAVWAALDRSELDEFRQRFQNSRSGARAFAAAPLRVPPDGKVVFLPLAPDSR